VVFL
jgi:hypothetical protein